MTVLLQDKLAAAYDELGYFIHPEPIISADLVERAREGMDQIRHGVYDTGTPVLNSPWNPGDDERRLCKIEMPQIGSLGVREALSSKDLGALAAQITGASMVQVWWTQLLYKPSAAPTDEVITNVGWHRDRAYWGSWEEGSELFTAWLALSDVDENSGPMKFVKESHRWTGAFGGNFHGQDLETLKAQLTPPPGKAWEEDVAILKPGGVSFHDDEVIHGSGQNYSGRPRRSLAIHMRTQNSAPVGGKREGLTRFIDDLDICPVIYG